MTPSRLTPAHIEDAAFRIGCDPAHIHAVVVVETGGAGGFLSDDSGRPRILFEAHIFHRLTKGRYAAEHPNISSPVWDRRLYYGGALEYERLALASGLDNAAAYMSASWGLFQILGRNFGLAGFTSVHAMVAAMRVGEKAHLDAFLAFCESTGCADELVRGDWAGFARIYNGPGYAANHYDTKLAAAAAEARRTHVRPGTLAPAPALGIARSPVFPDVLRSGQRGEAVRILQAKLIERSAGPLLVDGVFGRATEKAVERYQANNGLVVDGIAGPKTLEALGL